MKIVLYLLGEKGLQSLKALDADHHDYLHCVVIGKDKNVQNDFSEEIESYCMNEGIRHSYNDQDFSMANYLLAIGWRKLITTEARQKLIVLHDSLLPRYRGFNPLVTALINGDTEIGVTAIFGRETYDTGPIISNRRIEISYPIKIQEAIRLISPLYGSLLNECFEKLLDRSVNAIPQDESLATYSLWRNEEDYFINWSWDSEKIARMVDAVGFPYDGAKFRINDKQFSLIKATPVQDLKIENRDPGKVIFKDDGKLVIVCGEGLLRLDEVINENGETESFENKFRIKVH